MEMDISEDGGVLDLDGLSSVLIACNVSDNIFNNEDIKAKFEKAFTRINCASFVYLPSFKRIRITYDTVQSAIQAKMTMDQLEICNQPLNLYFLTTTETSSNNLLSPPIPEKQFLISPPASPPVGWVQHQEDEPFCFDLVSAVLELAPGQDHKIHEGTNNSPSVVVSVCDEPITPFLGANKSLKKIQQTRRPGVPSYS